MSLPLQVLGVDPHVHTVSSLDPATDGLVAPTDPPSLSVQISGACYAYADEIRYFPADAGR